MSDQLAQFRALFTGREDVYGTNAGPVEHITCLGELEHNYKRHLTGKGGIGIFPMRDDNTVLFAAIDLDEPDFELARTMQKLVPGQSWIERSRSGNAHVWVFFESPCPAWAARAILRGATEAVGRPDVEIFPKQDGLRKGGVGNYINLPYCGLKRFVEVDDYPLPLADFLRRASESRQDPEAWIARARNLGAKPPEERDTQTEWGTSPALHMCAKKIIAERFTNPLMRGHRHQVLFHLACQLLNYRDFDRDEAWEWLGEVNNAADVPLGDAELTRLFENAEQGQFTSTGCDDPVMQAYVHPDCKIANG